MENYSLIDVVFIYSQKRLFQRLYDHDEKETYGKFDITNLKGTCTES